jgi:hypothetical protein
MAESHAHPPSDGGQLTAVNLAFSKQQNEELRHYFLSRSQAVETSNPIFSESISKD